MFTQATNSPAQTMKSISRIARGFTLVESLVTIVLVSGFVFFTCWAVCDDDPNSSQVSYLCAKKVLASYREARRYGVEFKTKTPEGIIGELVKGVKSPNRQKTFSVHFNPEYAGGCAKRLYLEGGVLQLKEDD